MTALRDGKLEQACDGCGRWEAAGGYCTGCARPMTETDWYANGDESRRAVAQERAAEIRRTHPKRGRGRPRRVEPSPARGRGHPLPRPSRAPSPRSAPNAASAVAFDAEPAFGLLFPGEGPDAG